MVPSSGTEIYTLAGRRARKHYERIDGRAAVAEGTRIKNAAPLQKIGLKPTRHLCNTDVMSPGHMLSLTWSVVWSVSRVFFRSFCCCVCDCVDFDRVMYSIPHLLSSKTSSRVLCFVFGVLFTRGRGLTFTSARVLVRAPVNGPGRTPTDAKDHTQCAVRAPTHTSSPRDWAVTTGSQLW